MAKSVHQEKREQERFLEQSTSSSHTSTSIISGPIWQIRHHGIIYSWSGPKIPQRRKGPGTTRAVMQPLHSSRIRSHTFPSFLQLQRLMTSFSFNSQNLIGVNILPPFIWPISGLLGTVVLFRVRFPQK